MLSSTVLLHIAIILITYAEGHDLVNMAVILGHSICMTCGESANESGIKWKIQPVGDFEEFYIFNGYRILQRFSEFRVVSDGKFRLNTAEAQVKHAGTYFCIRITGHQTETHSAQLTVVDSVPICRTNLSNNDYSVVETEYLKLWCKINYVGNLIPRMEWQRNNADNLTANSTRSLQELISVIILQMRAEDNAINYTVTTFFETPADATSHEDVLSASNRPEYKWIFSANVLFGPKDVSIAPKKANYHAGDVFRCSADGNPTPTFEWAEIGTAYYVEGPELIVNKTMALKPESTYRCTAVNTVAGQRKIASATVVVGVPDTLSDKYLKGLEAFVCVGVGAAVIGVVLTVATAALCRFAKCKCKVSSPNAESSDDSHSSAHNYEYVSSENVQPPPTTSSQEINSPTNTVEEITVQATATNTEDSEMYMQSKQEYNTLCGQSHSQRSQIYTTIKATYENVQYPEI